MTDLAKLVVRLEAQTADYQKSLERAERQLTKFKKNTEGSLKSIQTGFAKVQKTLGVIGIGASVAMLTTGMVRAAGAAIEFGDEVNKAVAKTGVSAEAFSELAYAAKQSDIELSSLSTAFKKMQQAVSQAGSGSKQMQAVFKALRIDFDEFRKLAPDQQFEAIAEQISKIKDPADRTRAAVELFGRAGADLLPLFEEGAEGLRKAREEAERMGATLTGEQAKRLAEADDAIKRLGQAWDGVTRSLVLGVEPALTATLNAMNNALSKEPKVYSLAEAWEAVKRAISKDGLGTNIFDIMEEMQKGPPPTRRPTSGLPPGGRNRGRSQFDFTLPEDDAKAKAAAEKAAAAAERERLAILEKQADAHKAVLDAGLAAIEGLRTPVEEQIAQYHEQKYALEELARTYPNMAAQAAEALKRLEVEGLEDITITAEKIFPEKEQKKLSIFWEEAARNFQDILSDFLFDPFSEGIDGMIQDFVDMLRRMAAQAVAAQIGSKIFGAPNASGAPSGGGWLDAALGWGSKILGGFFGGMGGGGLEDIAVTAQKIPVPFSGPRASGGDVYPGRSYIVGDQGRAERFVPMVRGRIERAEQAQPMVNNFHFTIDAPTGTVSRSTQAQTAAAAARAVGVAMRRNS